MTKAEVQAEIGPGVKVGTVMVRYGIRARKAAKRDQHGPMNHAWKGDGASYQALHLRVQSERGTPSLCVACTRTDAARYEWANLTGNYADIYDYVRLCASCHRRMDAYRRNERGATLSSHVRRVGDA